MTKLPPRATKSVTKNINLKSSWKFFHTKYYIDSVFASPSCQILFEAKCIFLDSPLWYRNYNDYTKLSFLWIELWKLQYLENSKSGLVIENAKDMIYNIERPIYRICNLFFTDLFLLYFTLLHFNFILCLSLFWISIHLCSILYHNQFYLYFVYVVFHVIIIT